MVGLNSFQNVNVITVQRNYPTVSLSCDGGSVLIIVCARTRISRSILLLSLKWIVPLRSITRKKYPRILRLLWGYVIE